MEGGRGVRACVMVCLCEIMSDNVWLCVCVQRRDTLAPRTETKKNICLLTFHFDVS